jgi:hypothetical protein
MRAARAVVHHLFGGAERPAQNPTRGDPMAMDEGNLGPDRPFPRAAQLRFTATRRE